MSKYILYAIITGIGLSLIGILSSGTSTTACNYEGPKVSSGTLPNKHIYAACTSGSLQRTFLPIQKPRLL